MRTHENLILLLFCWMFHLLSPGDVLSAVIETAMAASLAIAAWAPLDAEVATNAD